VNPLVRATGRSITVTISPADEIADIDGYDPVAEETKAALADTTLAFSRGLRVEELKTQLSNRLKEEYDINYVDLELETDGTITYLGVGRQPAGLGPTLQPGMDATAIRADPAFSATPGDSIQIWRRDGTRVGNAELRAAVGMVATVIADETIVSTLDPATNYRLLTLPSDSRPEREFAGMLRRADETLSVFTLADRSPLIGTSVGDLDLTLIAIETPDGKIETIPSRDRLLAAGEELFALGKPAALRRLEAGVKNADVYAFAEPVTDGAKEEPVDEATEGPADAQQRDREPK